MKPADRDAYGRFTQGARHRGLQGAAEAPGLGVAPHSRRMRVVGGRIGRRLFVHGEPGCTITAEGAA